MSLKKYMIFIILILFFSSSCDKSEETYFSGDKRTVLIYMIADNSLDTYAQENMIAILKGAEAGLSKTNLLVYIDKQLAPPQLYHIISDNRGRVTKVLLKTYEEQNSASADVMKLVLSEVYGKFPSPNNGLILWSHGMGWIPPNSSTARKLRALYKLSSPNLPRVKGGGEEPKTKWFGQDENSYMSIADLNQGLSAAPHLDFIIFDACFMSSIESCYEIKDKADYIIGSPTEVLADGFPYEQIIPAMNKEIFDLKEICYIYFDFYNKQKDVFRSATISLIKTSELEGLAAAAKPIYSRLTKPIDDYWVQRTQVYDRGFSGKIFFDLSDYIHNIADEPLYNNFLEQMDRCVIYKQATPSFLELQITKFSGLSCYIPQTYRDDLNNAFVLTSWYKATH